jgi:hypothetical protein
LRITFDSNAWEQVFADQDADLTGIRAALVEGRIWGFICETGFRIEAIRKKDRPVYFQQPYMSVQSSLIMNDGRPTIKTSIGPDDSRHPGLPYAQRLKLERALSAGIKLLRGGAWMGLPVPSEIRDPSHYVQDEPDVAFERQQREIDISYQIEQRGVGKAAFDAADGWEICNRDAAGEQRLSKACAEWADGETVAAHFAYKNDILCSNDQGRSAGQSIFDPANRAWLGASYQMRFTTVGDLAAMVSP